MESVQTSEMTTTLASFNAYSWNLYGETYSKKYASYVKVIFCGNIKTRDGDSFNCDFIFLFGESLYGAWS
jgi:hypothetical protein